MKNYLLITTSLITAFGLAACSTQSTNRTITTHSTSKQTSRVASQPPQKNTTRNQQIANQQRQAANQKEQARLAYNRTWTQQQVAQKKVAQANANRLAAQRQAQLQAAQKNKARQTWLQQQAIQKQRVAQQQAAQQRAAQQRVAQQRVAQQRVAQQRAAQQRAAQQRITQQRAIQKQQQLALLRQKNQQYAHSNNGRSGINGLSDSEIRAIGDKIFKNESGSSIANLVHWNNGENFASMGIGHFTWYPSGRRARFGNTFPGLLDHLQSKGVQLPTWVQKARYTGAPWRTRTELSSAKRSQQVQELQHLLYKTRYLQAVYILERAKRAMPRIVKATPAHLKRHVAQNLNAVANTRGGWYALIDYVNFKGEGLVRHGGYKGQNWGLLQVLENMRPSQPGQQALNNFADSATAILQRRVNNSDPRRNEAKWMRGWTVRINTYRHPFVI